MNAAVSRRRILHIALLLSVLALLCLPSLTAALQPDGVTAAWKRARAAGAYHFDSDVVQVTTPVATITNVGQRASEERLRLEGSTDLRTQSMELKLWSRGGSVLQDETGVAVRVEDGKTFVRQGTGAWEEASDFTSAVAPQGDFMAYLRAVRDVEAHAPETRAGMTFTRHTFQIHGPTFAAYVRDQVEASMQAEGSLPAGASIEIPRYYQEMTGEGELWVSADGLPLRQILHLQFPEHKDERVSADITVTFSRFGAASTGLFGIGRAISALAADPVRGPSIVLWAGFAALLIRYRRSRRLQQAISLAVIAALIVSPLLTGIKMNTFFGVQGAKAAEQEQQQQTSNMERDLNAIKEQEQFDPHADPLAAVTAQTGPAAISGSGNMTTSTIAASETANDAKDGDGDGLTDWVEEQLGTDPSGTDTNKDGVPDGRDTDGDRIDDGVEIRGVVYPPAGDPKSKTWYLDALEADSNADGITDMQEYDTNADNGPDDTDADKIPDIFDDDNDGDGVLDRLDLAPFQYVRPGANDYLSDTKPFSLTIQNLTEGQLTFVDFQIRPKKEEHLWYAYNVLDWPEDRQAQIQDGDGQTFRDVAQPGAATEPSDAWGDTKVLPMLELRIKHTTASPSNLPAKETLAPYNITMYDYNKEGTEKVVYVPLSVVNDEQSGARVAFNGRMVYQPASTWGDDPHSIRMVWAVQMLVDVCKEARDGVCVAYEQANVPQVAQTYYDEWTLTGLNVREDHGAKVTIVHEDPAVDTPATAATVEGADTTGAGVKDDRNLWALASGLDNHFVTPTDADNGGVRDVQLHGEGVDSDIVKRFRRGNIPDTTDPRRWGTPDVFAVDEHWYPTLAEAVADTAANKTKTILQRFDKYWSGNDPDPIMPLLIFAREDHYRGLGLDSALAGGGYVSHSGGALSIDMQPDAQPAVTIDTTAGLSWSAYCADPRSSTSSMVAWDTCDYTQYWDTLAKRHKGTPGAPGPGETAEDKKNEVDGEMFAVQLYYLTLAQGLNAVVQQGTRILKPSTNVVVPSDTDTMEENKKAAKFGRMAVVAMINQVLLAKYLDYVAVKRFLGYTINKIKLGLIDNAVTNGIRDLFAKSKWKGALAGTGAVAGAMILIAGLAVGVSYLMKYYLAGDPGQMLAAKIVVNTLVAGLIVFLSTVKPVMSAMKAVQRFIDLGDSIATSLRTVARSSSIVAGTARTAGVIGAVIAGLVTWGFFIWSVTEAGVDPFSPEFNTMLAETIAATIYLIVMTVLSATVIGLIIVGILSAVDAILTAICESGHDDLKGVEGMDGTCFTLSGAAIKQIAKVIYAYEPMIDLEHKGLVAAGHMDVKLQDPDRGYIASNSLSVSMPVTTTIRHKDPTGENLYSIVPYLYYFSEDNLRSSTFKYSTTRNPEDISAGRDEMKAAWTTTQDHVFSEITIGTIHYRPLTVGHAMYRGHSRSGHGTLTGVTLPAGVNQSLDFYLNMGYAVPAYECWLVPYPIPPFGPPIPVCYTRTLDGKNSSKIDALKFDILPDTIEDFMATVDAGNGGQRLAWDASFGTLYDPDGDGLVSTAYAGIDVNDHTWDSDDDGLSDKFELERREQGVSFATSKCDTDGDTLTDAQEMRFGTHPSRPDTDNDGLEDDVEVYHQVYVQAGGACVATPDWAGGWQVTIPGATGGVSTRVSSDPTHRDADGDGVGDQAEMELVAEGKVFHPKVWNTNPIQVLVQSDDPDGIVAPGQSVNYSTIVQRDDTAMGKGVLEVTKPPILGTDLPLYTLDLDTQQSILKTTALSVPSDAATSDVTLTSSVRARMAGSGETGWQWNEPTNLGQVTGDTTPTRYMDVAASRVDRPDSYLLSAMTSSSASPKGTGDIRISAASASRTVDADNNNQDFLRGNTAARVACNDMGQCMTVWEHYDHCNTLNITKVYIARAENDYGTHGIEAHIYLNGKFLYDAGQDREEGYVVDTQISEKFCGDAVLEVRESDGGGNYAVIGSWTIYENTFHEMGDVYFTGDCFEGACNSVTLVAEVPEKHRYDVAGAISGSAAEALPWSLSSRFSLADTSAYAKQDFAPVVASDGTDFLVAWERIEHRKIIGIDTWSSSVVTRRFNLLGVPYGGEVISDSQLLSDGSYTRSSRSRLEVAWIGSRYRVARKITGSTHIQLIDLARNGSFIAVTTAAMDALKHDDELALAYNPATDQTLLAYSRYESWIPMITGVLFDSTGATVRPNTTLESVASHPHLAYHAQTGGWLFAWEPPGGDLVYRLLKADLTRLLSEAEDFRMVGFSPAAEPLRPGAIACPNPRSLPVMTLPFEELPGATQWNDSTANGNDALAGLDTRAPMAGASGAPDAPLSDYGIWFDGDNDYAAIPNHAEDDFTIAFWIKTTQQTGGDTHWTQGMGIVDGNFSGVANDFGISLGNGKVLFGVGTMGVGDTTIKTGDLADGAWHFVVATRQRSTGAMRLYVDGNTTPAASGTGGTTSLTTTGTTLRLGQLLSGGNHFRGSIDHLSLYRSALSADAAKGLHDQSIRPFCLATAPGVDGQTGPENPYAELELKQIDPRGGPLQPNPASLNLRIDGDSPSAGIDSFEDRMYIQGLASTPQTVIVGGSAEDRTSAIDKVEVSVNGGAAQTASGAATWTYALTGNEGVYDLRARATDAAGNAGTWGARRTLHVDATPPTISVNPATGTVVPRRDTAGQWMVDLQGTVADPNIGTHPGSGVAPGSVEVLMEAPGGAGLGNGWQKATLQSSSWRIAYALPSQTAEPFGTFTIKVRAADTVGNQAVDDGTTLDLDAVAPRASLDAAGAEHTVIAEPLALTGLITETGSAGLSDMQIRFVPVEQVVAVESPTLQLAFDGRPSDVFYPDTSLQHNHARCTTSTCPIGVAGRVDGALSFDGTAMAEVAHDTTIDFGQNESFTIGAWIKASSGLPDGTNAKLLIKRGSGATQWYTLQLDGTGAAALELTGGLNIGGGPDLRDDTWHHIVGVLDRDAGQEQARLYLDGLLVAARDFTGAVDNSAPLELGGWSGTGNERFAGSIDQVTIFDRALPAQEIASLHAAADVPWQAATLGTPVPTADGSAAAWSAAVPADLEGKYQVDLRGSDTLSNRLVTAQVWRGIIDTRAPRIVAKAEPTGAEYFDEQTQQQHYEIEITCAAEDLHLNDADFTCPGGEGKIPVRSFAEDPALETRFPDWTQRTGLALTFTRWSDSATPVAAMKACDVYGNCTETGMPAQDTTTEASDSTTSEGSALTLMELSETEEGDDGGTTTTSLAAEASDKALAMVIDPTDGSFLASTGTVRVTVAAEASAGASLSVVTVSLLAGETWTELWRSEPASGATRINEEVELTSLAEGTYQVVAQAVDSSGNTSDPLPVSFTVDRNLPSVALTQQELTVDDTYQLGSGIMRLRGTAADTVGLAAVQIKVGDGPWMDVTFKDGLWHTAVPLGSDSEGKTFSFTVRAIDRAGQIVEAERDLTAEILPAEDLPDTTVTNGPAAFDNSTAPSFEFAAEARLNPLAGFKCRIDGGAYSGCVSPMTYSGLSEGEHLFEVSAIDTKGFPDLEPAASSWTIDTTEPETSIVQAPATLVNVSNVTFEFAAADDNGSGVDGFECKLDGGAFTTCGETQIFPNLADGNHTLEVRAIDTATNVDTTPESFAWFVDTTAPDTTIDAKPAALTNVNTATFKFTGSDDGGSGVARFECARDGGAWEDCASPVSYTDLQDGEHSFAVQAFDQAGNVDAEPEAFKWTVDTTGPETSITGQPDNPDPDRNATFTFSGDDGTGSGVDGFDCRLDAGGWSACDTGEQSYSNLAYGDHTFEVRAYDRATNRDQSPATLAWTVLNPTALDVAPATGTYGGSVTLSATLTSGGTGVSGKPVSFTLNGTAVCGAGDLPDCPTTDGSGVATLADVPLGAIAAGEHATAVEASFTRDALYESGSDTGSLTVAKAVLTGTAVDASRTYGASAPAFAVTYTGFQNGETTSVLGGSPVCTSTATHTSPVSPPTYPITCGVGTLEATNYSFTFVAGALTITPATLTVTPDAQTKQYSDPLPEWTVQYTGFENDDDSSDLAGTLSCVTTATTTSPAGTYPITCSGLSAANYQLSYQPGTLTLAKETAAIAYTGDMDVLTAGPRVSTAAVRLGASLTQDPDSHAGDLSLARVRFEIFKATNLTSTPDVVVKDVPVDAEGNAVTSVNLGVDTWTVKVTVEAANGYWTASPMAMSIINVALGSTEKRVTGGGWIADDKSATGKGNFGFTVSPQKSGSPKGNAIYLFRGGDGYTYLVKSNSWQGGGLTFYSDPSKAAFSGRAVVQKIDAVTGTVVESWANYRFMVDLVDGAILNPRQSDRYAITIKDAAGVVWRQLGTAAAPVELGGGNLTVKSK